MLTNKEIRQKLKQKQTTIGTWVQIPSSETAEIIGRLGYDWAAVDMEHGAFTRSQLPDIFRALERWGTTPLARLAEATMENVKAALDSGAQGLVFPMIVSVEQLDNAIAWSQYPSSITYSNGKRGVGFCRGNAYGLDFESYMQNEASETVLIAQIEHADALPNLDAIFSHPRLDAFLIGPYDLSASMGLTGKFDHPDFLAALRLIQEKAAQHDLASGYHVVAPDPTALEQAIVSGYSFIAYGIDTLFLQLGKRPK